MKWIWLQHQEKNTFAEFTRTFTYEGGKVALNISADFRYAAFLNGQMVSCGQYADTPKHKSVNTADLTDKVKKGQNTVHIIAWHMGEDHFVCQTMTPAVGYEILVDGKVLVEADKSTLCRKAKGYTQCGYITGQLGFGFNYDFNDEGDAWVPATEVITNFNEIKRPILQTTVAPLCTPDIVAQGVFEYNGEEPEGATAAWKMQNAWLSSRRFSTMTTLDKVLHGKLKNPLTFTAKGGNGTYVIADMGRETCGHLGLTVTVDKPCKVLLGWGEHLADLRIRTEIDGRNFAITLSLKAGENILDDYLNRFGCRYICLFVENESFTLSRLGIREVGYPFKFPKKDFGDKLLNSIYELGRRTLYLSAHEHYEDCPWREQALYGMDSRNQMLFGYGAFEEYEFPRANIAMMGHSMREDGMIAICAPSVNDLCIPSFTAYWLIAIAENVERDYKQSFVQEMLPYIEQAMSAFLAKEGECGISIFTEPMHWNFHEWSDGMEGYPITRDYWIESQYDANLTSLMVIASKMIADVMEKIGKADKAEEYRIASARLAKKLECFYDESRGQYTSYIKDGKKIGYHVYTQSLALYTGAVEKQRAKAICKMIQAPEESGLVPATFAAFQLKYEVLIKYGDALDFCLKEVEEVFSKMLFAGATSYWETANGEADFCDAGSLCHGWSAVGCWLMDNYVKQN